MSFMTGYAINACLVKKSTLVAEHAVMSALLAIVVLKFWCLTIYHHVSEHIVQLVFVFLCISNSAKV